MCSNQYVFVLCYFGVLRALDILSDEVLVELSAAYRKMVSPLPPLKTPQSVSEFLFKDAHCLTLFLFFFSPPVK